MEFTSGVSHPSNTELWNVATLTHKFLQGCGDSSITTSQFDTWLLQDYYYVRQFNTFLLSVMNLAPIPHKEVLQNGLSAVDLELRWFEAKLDERNISYHQDNLLPVTIKYIEYLKRVESYPYSIQALILYAIEHVYNKAWSNVLKEQNLRGQSRFIEFAERWGNPEFGEYVIHLKKQSDEVAEERQKYAVDNSIAEIEDLYVREVLMLECEFWDMAFTA